MQINITKISIVVSKHSTDRVYLQTELPLGIWPYKDTAYLSMEVAKGKGVEYVSENFPGVPCEVIESTPSA